MGHYWFDFSKQQSCGSEPLPCNICCSETSPWQKPANKISRRVITEAFMALRDW